MSSQFIEDLGKLNERKFLQMFGVQCERVQMFPKFEKKLLHYRCISFALLGEQPFFFNLLLVFKCKYMYGGGFCVCILLLCFSFKYYYFLT